MLFSRGRTKHTDVNASSSPSEAATTGAKTPPNDAGQAAAGSATPEAAAQPGPWDASECPHALEGYTDLGYLQLPAVEGMQVTGACDANGLLAQIDLAIQDVSMNLMLLASARSKNLWREGYRQEFATELERNGYSCTAVDYPAGSAICALPQREQGDEGAVPLQVEGYPGRGWMLRVVYRGSAVTDSERLEMLRDVARRVVLTRAPGLFTPGDVLPLSAQPLWQDGTNDRV